MKSKMTIAVPSGIGDVSWILSKLVHVADDVDLHFQVADGAPYRTVPFLRLLPWVKSAEYGNFHYNDLFFSYRGQNTSTWKEIVDLEAGRIWLTNNEFLEAGNRLENWLPDLPTDFHYKIPENKLGKVRANNILEACRRRIGYGPFYGISAASYRGAHAWNTWDYENWATFLTLWHEYDKKARFILMGGGWDDLTRSLYDEFDNFCFDAVGKTSIATAIELHRKIQGYVGFSSGLGIIRTVLDLKTFMLWPAHQEKLSTSWAPPEMLKDGRYSCCLWQDPEVVFGYVKDWLRL